MAFRTDVEDFGAFYERTYQVAFRTALAIVRDGALAADVTQDAYVTAFRSRDRFRGDAPGHAWLHRIVVNAALSSLRRRRSRIHELLPVDPETGMDAPAIGDPRTSADRLAILEALDELTPRQRAAVVLRYYHDYDYATIASMLGTTSTNVGAMLSRARDRLRAELEPQPVAAAAAMGR